MEGKQVINNNAYNDHNGIMDQISVQSRNNILERIVVVYVFPGSNMIRPVSHCSSRALMLHQELQFQILMFLPTWTAAFQPAESPDCMLAKS